MSGLRIKPFSLDEVVGQLPDLPGATERPAQAATLLGGGPRRSLDELVDVGLTHVKAKGRNAAAFDVICQARDEGYTEDEVRAALPTLVARFDRAHRGDHPYLISEAEGSLQQVFGRAPREPQPIDGAVAIPFSSIQAQPVSYVIDDRVPRGMVALLAGDPGLGKSLMTAYWAAVVTKGTGPSLSPGDVLFLNDEDSPGATSRPRLEAAGADLNRVHAVRMKKKGEEVGIVLPDDIREIERLIGEHRVDLVIIDPINNYIPARVDSWKDTDVRGVLAPLSRLAERTGVAVVVVVHLTKAQTNRAIHRILGSVGYGGVGRSVLMLDRDPDDPDGERGSDRILAQAKSNVGPLAPSLRYAIEACTISTGIETAKLVPTGESPYSAEEIVSGGNGRKPKRKTETAKDLLRLALRDAEWHPAKEVKAFVAAWGISEATVERAKRELGVEVDMRGGFPPVRLWRLPPGPDTPAPAGPEDHDGTASQVREIDTSPSDGRP